MRLVSLLLLVFHSFLRPIVVTCSCYDEVVDTKVLASKAICDNFTWERKLSREPWLGLKYQYPETIAELPTTSNCRMLIVCAGFPRSGSTLQCKLIEEVLKLLRVKFVSMYWNYHLHAFGKLGHSKAHQKMLLSGDKIGRLDNSTVLVLKSHEYDGTRMKRFCQQQLIFTTHRNLVDVTESMIRAGWVRNTEATIAALRDYIQNYECWHLHGATDIEYETFSTEIRWLGMNILSVIAAALNDSNLDLCVHSAEVDRVLSKYVNMDANPGIPGAQGNKKVLDLQYLKAIENAFDWWLGQKGYATRVP